MQAVVLIPKGKGDYREIFLVEVTWKVVAETLNRQLTASITFHDFLHGFREGCSMGTATLEAKLLQQLAALREYILYVIFMNLHKVYDALDRSRCLELLEIYGVGPRARRILWIYWGQLRMVAKAGGYYRWEFKGTRGVTQGDLLSPTIFTMVVDTMVRHWVTVMVEIIEEQGRSEQEGRHQNFLFYTDDGMVASSDP